MSEFVALIHKERPTGFGASFPDFPGDVTVADTLEQLRVAAEEVLAFHIEGMMEEDDEFPAASALDTVIALDDYKDAVAVLVVKAPETVSPAVRINVTIPDQMLKRIDRHAAKHGLTRSGFLVKAVRAEIEARAEK